MENLHYIAYTFTKLRDGFELKTMLGLVMAMLSYLFDPTHLAGLLAVFILICVDFVFGIAASRKTNEPVRSAKCRRTAIKIAVYFLLIAAARVTEYALPLAFLDESVMGFLAATELMSVLENAGRLGYVVPKQLIKVLGDFTQKK